MTSSPEYTLITESFNLVEGQSLDSLRASLAALVAICARHDAEILVSDCTGDARVRELVAACGGHVRILDTPELDYDAQKNLAASEARGDWVVFLDGDCRPLRDDWLERLTAPLRDGSADAVGGLTFYDEPSPDGIAATIMDFGFLWDGADGALDCYAANNAAFPRALRCALPVPEGSGLRCNCYAHTQALIADRRRVRVAPDAVVLHEMPDVASERYRRGADLIAACWSNPLQIESSQLHASEPAFLWQLRRLQFLDTRRLADAPEVLGVTDANRGEIVTALAKLRRMEALGIRDALIEGEQNGRNAEARSAYAHWQKAQRAVMA